ncbi:cell division protein FtsQ/DivIB [Halalkalibacter urbisdiaboli]|uniref:cell division protein FtsQ/DivIB n=1 Tax=Halalkalibacter urbisdiaboli TaxID=1960589 RepID=UPI000B447387|nr:cell division protein FtsQ/DivIB [Halalkalibacter urbisdiaboli]
MSTEKIVTINERIPSLKEQRKRRANQRLLFFLLLFFVLLLLMVYFQSPLSHIKKIEVQGNYLLQDEVIIKSSGLSIGTSIWNLQEEERQEKIIGNPEVVDATISRQLPNTVVIHVSEYPRVGYLLNDGKYYPILSTGAFLGPLERQEFPADAPILVDWKQGSELGEMAAELTKMPEQINERISEIFYTPTDTDPFYITIHMNDGYEVHSTIRNFSERMAPYPSIIQELDPKKKGIIHMRMSPYFEEFSNKEEEESEGEG